MWVTGVQTCALPIWFGQRLQVDLIVEKATSPWEELTENRVSTDVLVGVPRRLHTPPTQTHLLWEGTTGNKPLSPLVSVISIPELFTCAFTL